MTLIRIRPPRNNGLVLIIFFLFYTKKFKTVALSNTRIRIRKPAKKMHSDVRMSYHGANQIEQSKTEADKNEKMMLSHVNNCGCGSLLGIIISNIL